MIDQPVCLERAERNFRQRFRNKNRELNRLKRRVEEAKRLIPQLSRELEIDRKKHQNFFQRLAEIHGWDVTVKESSTHG